MRAIKNKIVGRLKRWMFPTLHFVQSFSSLIGVSPHLEKRFVSLNIYTDIQEWKFALLDLIVLTRCIAQSRHMMSCCSKVKNFFRCCLGASETFLCQCHVSRFVLYLRPHCAVRGAFYDNEMFEFGQKMLEDMQKKRSSLFKIVFLESSIFVSTSSTSTSP